MYKSIFFFNTIYTLIKLNEKKSPNIVQKLKYMFDYHKYKFLIFNHNIKIHLVSITTCLHMHSIKSRHQDICNNILGINYKSETIK